MNCTQCGEALIWHTSGWWRTARPHREPFYCADAPEPDPRNTVRKVHDPDLRTRADIEAWLTS